MVRSIFATKLPSNICSFNVTCSRSLESDSSHLLCLFGFPSLNAVHFVMAISTVKQGMIKDLLKAPRWLVERDSKLKNNPKIVNKINQAFPTSYNVMKSMPLRKFHSIAGSKQNLKLQKLVELLTYIIAQYPLRYQVGCRYSTRLTTSPN